MALPEAQQPDRATTPRPLPPPAGPGAPPRYRTFARIVTAGSVTTLVAFAVARHGLDVAGVAGWLLVGLGTLLTVGAGAAVLAVLTTSEEHRVDATAHQAAARLSSRRSDALVARVWDAIVVTDTSGRVVTWNAAAERSFGKPAAGALGMPCQLALGLRGPDGHELDCRDGCALLSGTPESAGVEVLRARADGRAQHLLANVAPVGGPDGRVVEVLHSLRDITRLREADDAKAMFLATASHELKTPLAVIQGFTEVLARDDLEPDQRELAAERVRSRVAELADIVDRLLTASRLEQGLAVVAAQPFHPVPLARERTTAFDETSEHTVRFASAVPDDASALGDAEGFATVLDHLIDNAIKYSPDGGAVDVEVGDADGSLTITVRDRGIGMDPIAVEHCFDRFWQAEGREDRRFGGTGLGLYLVRSLVEQMGGHVDVTSELGRGTTFVVRLATHVAPPERSPGRVRRRTGSGVVGDLLRHAGVGSEVR